MSNLNILPKPKYLSSWIEEMETMSKHIKEKALRSETINILEAGCGNMWGLDLGDTQYILTGVDIDKHGLEIRIKQQKDLDIGILGDLRDVILEEGNYDVIFNSYVLEHVDGAERVLQNFMRWLKPGGILVLRIPNRDSVRGFLTRITPFWFHIFYTKHFQGYKDAGKPGHAPFPTFYDKVVSRKGIYEFCNTNGLDIKAEYSGGHGRKNRWISRLIDSAMNWIFHLVSFNRVFSKHDILIYVIEKPSNLSQVTCID